MLHRNERVLYRTDGGTVTADGGTVLYAYAIWDVPTARSDEYKPAYDSTFARYIVRWDAGYLTYCEPRSNLVRLIPSDTQ